MLEISESGDRLLVRIQNSGRESLFVDWSRAHLRNPDDWEFPVAVVPHNALAEVYPGGRVEYHLSAAHTYAPPDQPGRRRNHYRTSLVPSSALFEGESYVIRLLVPICRGDRASCQEACSGSCPSWNLATILGEVELDG